MRVLPVSAPVFEPGGRVGATIMVLGPTHEVTGGEIAAMGDQVAAAATAQIHGRAPG